MGSKALSFHEYLLPAFRHLCSRQVADPHLPNLITLVSHLLQLSMQLQERAKSFQHQLENITSLPHDHEGDWRQVLFSLDRPYSPYLTKVIHEDALLFLERHSSELSLV